MWAWPGPRPGHGGRVRTPLAGCASPVRTGGRSAYLNECLRKSIACQHIVIKAHRHKFRRTPRRPRACTRSPHARRARHRIGAAAHRLPPAPYPPAATNAHDSTPPCRPPARTLKTHLPPRRVLSGPGRSPPSCAGHARSTPHPVPRPPLRNARSGTFAHARTHLMLPRIKAMLTCETCANSYLPIRLCDQPPVLFYNSLDVSRLAGHRIRAGIQGPMPVGACNP